MEFLEIVNNAFRESDIVGKAIVALLVCMSMYLWTILANKVFSVAGKKAECRKFNKYYRKVHSAIGIGLYLDELSGPLKTICAAGQGQLCDIFEIDERRRPVFLREARLPRRLTQAELDKIKTTMNNQVNLETLELESSLGWLSVLVTASPYLGLFGTVWGVMATFVAIAKKGNVEINSIAPGISGALLTTVAGLVVAIPAVIGNILINANINEICLQMDIFADDYIASLQLEDLSGQQKED